MNENKMLIWGAGRIGRGFVADLFRQAGYALTFVDADKSLVEGLKAAGKFAILHIPGKNQSSHSEVNGFEILNASERGAVEAALQDCTLMSVCVFPSAFDEVAATLTPELERRAAQDSPRTLDILICANTNHPSELLRTCFMGKLSARAQCYLEESVGLVDTAVMRMAIMPNPEQSAQDPFIVVTNGYKEMPVDAAAFKGTKPAVPGIVFVPNMRAEETRKMYTYNMLHALYAYVGQSRQLELVYDCTQNPAVESVADGAMDEVCAALMKEFGYSADEMNRWKGVALNNMANPALMDKLKRVGADPARKLKRDDRLVGPALLCRKHGVMPYYLAKAIAGGFVFENSGDSSCERIKNHIAEHGIKSAIREFCQLDQEVELIQLIAEQYQKFIGGGALDEDPARVAVIKKAYELGFKYEQTIKGCAQCTLATLAELVGKPDPALFQAASGLSGGIGLAGDGSCGGYTGGVMFMSSLAGRRLDQIPVDGDKIAQYRSYEMAQKLHDRYIETYGSVTCADIHRAIFGKAYCLRTSEVRAAFEAAGAHADKCTTVIATESAWVAEILWDEQLLPQCA